METDYVYYQVMRSRNKGDFWSNITPGINLSRETAVNFMNEEAKRHPSDWLRVIKVQSTTESEYNGNLKKSKQE